MFPVSFFPTLKYGNMETLKEGENEGNIFNVFDFSLVLIPIHKTSTDHWALSVIKLLNYKLH